MLGIVRHQGPLSWSAARCRRMASVAAGPLFNVTVGATGVAKRVVCGSELPTGWSMVAIIIGATCTAGIGPAQAAVDLSASASVGAEHDSNPIELSDSQAQDFLARGFIEQQDDVVKRLTATAGAITGGINAPTHLRLQGNYSKVENVHFDSLNHVEYFLGGSLDLKPSQVFDVSLQASENRTPVGLNDIGGQRSVQQTSRLAEGTLRVRPIPTWQLSLTPRWYQNELPLPNAGLFKLTESSGSVGLGYLGGGPLVPGVFYSQAKGEYSGVIDPTRYEQRSVGLSLNYKVTDFSSFSFFAGRAERTTHLIEPSSNPQAVALEGTEPAYTGSLAYQRQLSVKTRINVSAFRAFQQFEAGVNTKLATGFSGEITWAPTAKLSVLLKAQLVRSTIEGLQLDRTNSEREDLLRSYSLSAKYVAMRRVSLRPYYSRALSNSTARSAVFGRTIAGLDLTFSVD